MSSSRKETADKGDPRKDVAPESTSLIPQSEGQTRDLAKHGGGADQYPKIAQKAFDEKVRQTLQKPFEWDEFEIRPDGIIFIPAIRFEQRLDEAFGQGAWALKRRTEWTIVENVVIATFHLIGPGGQFLAESTGAQTYYRDNKDMDYGDAIEAAESNARMRCCKKLGVGRNAWDPNFRRKWRRENAIREWYVNEGSGRNKGQKRALWRRKDDDQHGYPWKYTGPDRTMKHPTPTKPSPSDPPAPSKKMPVKGASPPKDEAPTQPAAETGVNNPTVAATVTSAGPKTKSGLGDDVWTYRIKDETGAHWWGATSDEVVADVLTSAFQNSGEQIEVSYREHGESAYREILSAGPLSA